LTSLGAAPHDPVRGGPGTAEEEDQSLQAKINPNTVTAEADLPTFDEIRYIPPTSTGVATNGKTVLSLEQAIANLNRTGAIWDVGPNGQITYSFLDKAPTGLYNSPKETYLGGLVEGFLPFTAEQRTAARDALQLWDDLIAPSFVEKKGQGAADILFTNTNSGPGQAAAFTPFLNGGSGKYSKVQGDIFVNQDQPSNFNLDNGGYGQTTLVHELGHTLGLSHTGDYDAGDDRNGDGKPDPISYANDAEFFQDTYQFSIMSYFSHSNSGAFGYVNWATGGFFQTPQTPMVHDIAAVQAMYGADLTTRTGDTTYGFNSNAGRSVFDFTSNKNPFVAIYDAGGNDTLDLSGFTGGRITLDLRPGAFSTGYNYGDAASLNKTFNVAFSQAIWNAIYDGRTGNPGFLSDNIGIAYNTIIENGRTGAGNDLLVGNDVANRLEAGAGNDTINGGKGNDTLVGGSGLDTFVIADTGGLDTILDFTRGSDKLDFSAFDPSSAPGNQAMTWIAQAAFTGRAGELRSYVEKGVTFVAGDVNGDGIADFTVSVGAQPIGLSDILL
jgi:serralysin